MPPGFDRVGQNAGNIVLLEHINVMVPDQVLTTDFYISALSMTRDPYYMVHTDNFWANHGLQQLHLQEGQPMRFRGEIVLVTDILDLVRANLASAHPRLQGTEFSWSDEGSQILATCPWGNHFRLVEEWPGFESARGIACAITQVPPGSAKAIVEFYREIMGALVVYEEEPNPQAKVQVGPGQHLIYRETDGEILPYDGHHVCVYVTDMNRVYDFMLERGLVTLEDCKYQFRFQAILDVSSGDTVYELEHEVRSLRHPFYKRELINRRGDEALP